MKADWEVKKLGEVCSFIAGYTPKSNELSETGEVPYFKISDMNRQGNELYLTETELFLNETKRIYPKNSIVFPKNGGAVFTNKKRILFQDSVIDLNSEAIHPKENIDVYFLYHYFQTIDLKNYSKGAALPTVDMTRLKAIEIPVPPLPEQKRIVEILDQKFAQIDQLKQNAAKNLQNAKELFQAELTKAFSNNTWEKKRMGEIFEMVRGPFGGSLKKECFKPSGYPVYEQQCAIHSNYNFRYFIDEKKFEEMKRFTVGPGDFVMSCSGVTMAKVSKVPHDARIGIINQALLKLSLIKNVDSTYMLYYLSADFFREILMKDSKGAAIPNMPSVKILKQIEFSLPPLSEQQKIVAHLDALQEKVRQLEEIYTKQIANCDELKQSFLKKSL